MKIGCNLILGIDNEVYSYNSYFITLYYIIERHFAQVCVNSFKGKFRAKTKWEVRVKVFELFFKTSYGINFFIIIIYTMFL